MESRKAAIQKKKEDGTYARMKAKRKEERAAKDRLIRASRLYDGNPFAQIPMTRDQARYRAKKAQQALARGDYPE